MQNFEYLSPTKIIFGQGSELRAGAESARFGKKILLLYGQGNIKVSGLYDKIVDSLLNEGVEFVELGGVQPNPRLSLVEKGIKICREQEIGFILAVGGGSVVDTAKAIGIGVPYQGKVWDFYSDKALPNESLPTGAVITLAAAGSETSKSSVITNEDGWFKRGLNSDITRPKFALLNPELTFTLPSYQTACGSVDIMVHVLERYFTDEKNVDLTDRLCEATLCSVLKYAPLALRCPDDFPARAEIMWAAAIAHSDFLGLGRLGDWASHKIEHELSAIYDVAHGAGLAVIFPAWMKYVCRHNIPRFAQFAQRVFRVEPDLEFPENTALEGIKYLEGFFREMGMPTRLKDLNIGDERLGEMADKCRRTPAGITGNFVELKRNDVLNILQLAL
ncbi:MAG TPA: iron-containing alcohol dehydrogenase [Desulfitobacteriaceae bacterium]|nr:iron-containing alcohol dehydrogenase [Desulfitobacteriaceae bacterium]